MSRRGFEVAAVRGDVTRRLLMAMGRTEFADRWEMIWGSRVFGS